MKAIGGRAPELWLSGVIVILDQATNGLAVRMAVLYLCGGISTQ